MGDRPYVTKDSGKRVDFPSGMRRDVDEGKPRYDLIEPEYLKQWALLMARGAKLYGALNWQKADSVEERDRFRASAARHFHQWLAGDTDEAHGAAVAFNIAAAEFVTRKMVENNS